MSGTSSSNSQGEGEIPPHNQPNKMKFDKFDKILLGLYCVIVLIACGLIGYKVAQDRYKHLAIIHHAAFYEADSWGNVTFHWNDDSYAQAPFQDDIWNKIQNNLFEKKLNSLGIK
jgi:hypothetical protein